MIWWNPPQKAKEKQQLWLIAARLVSFPCCWINDRKSCWPSWLDGSAALLICHFAEERAAQVSLLLIPKCGNWVTRYDAAGSSQKSQNVVALLKQPVVQVSVPVVVLCKCWRRCSVCLLATKWWVRAEGGTDGRHQVTDPHLHLRASTSRLDQLVLKYERITTSTKNLNI